MSVRELSEKLLTGVIQIRAGTDGGFL